MKKLIVTLCLVMLAPAVSSPALSQQSGRAGIDRSTVVLRTVDRVMIRSDLFTAGNSKVIIYCHRLLRDNGGSEVDRLIEIFSDEYDILSVNSRGHSSSFGSSSVGGREILDLRAAVSYAKNSGYERVAVIGAGMGGTVGMRAALIFRNIDALVVISPSGFAPDISRFPIGFLTDIALDTEFGRIPLRIVTNTRLGDRYSAGFPVDMLSYLERVPTLIVHSSGDRHVSLKKLEGVLEEYFDPDDLVIVPGSRHAEDLMDRDVLHMVRVFLSDKLGRDGGDGAHLDEGVTALTGGDVSRIRLSGDLPIPERVALDELQRRFAEKLPAAGSSVVAIDKIVFALEEVLFQRGYTRASVSVTDTFPVLFLRIESPRIRSVSIAGNRFVKERYIEDVLSIDSDYFNAYELDAALRRLSANPSVESARPSINELEDGNIDIVMKIVERKPYRFLVATKFTDMDKYFGAGVTWNEFNPTGLRYEGMCMVGALDQEVLTSHRLGKNFLNGALSVSSGYFDVAKSRDDLSYVFTRQEVRERGGDASVRYGLSSSIAVTLAAFGKRYLKPVSLDHPVAEGTAAGGSVKLDLSGRLPFQGPSRFYWRHTAYYQKAGPRGVGDFRFDTYQFNIDGEVFFLRSSKTRTVIHGGWISGDPPPQELLSLGGMHTLPGYADDAFVGARMFRVGQELYLSARNIVNDASVWAPLSLILSFHAGTVWDGGEKFDAADLKTDVVVEFDYKETLRFGVAIPTGGRDDESPRFYIGWNEHVF